MWTGNHDFSMIDDLVYEEDEYVDNNKLSEARKMFHLVFLLLSFLATIGLIGAVENGASLVILVWVVLMMAIDIFIILLEDW